MPNRNKGKRFILIVVDTFSKYAWAEPVRNMIGKEVTEAFTTILERAHGHVLQNLQTDSGK